MNSVLKKFISIVLASIMALSIVLVGINDIKSEATSYDVGDIIEYGTYPQTDVTEILGMVLNSVKCDWKSYNYYRGKSDNTWAAGEMVPANYMKYKDVTYNGNKYRGIIFAQYRPALTEYAATIDNSNQDSYGYELRKTYWFKYEPIRWRVLDPSKGLLMCASVIDSQPFHNYYNLNQYGDDTDTFRPNNYTESDIRKWLNETFYNTAFSESEKDRITLTEISNKCDATLRGYIGWEQYDLANTEDKVFLLSYSDLNNSSYGFSNIYDESDSARILHGSDYAKSQGLLYSPDYPENAWWWLRTPFANDNRNVRFVHMNGSNNNAYFSSNAAMGVCPAMCLSEIKSSCIGSEIKETGDGYILGYDTYSFANFPYIKGNGFGCTHSLIHKGGHCFGMAASSSGYYLGKISKGSYSGLNVNEFPDENVAKSVICYYMSLQGSAVHKSIVAGDSYCKTFNSKIGELLSDIYSDWQQVINYVKDHSYDYKGNLIVDLLYKGSITEGKSSSHAVNFLYYKKVAGKDRLYVYDNNYPNEECYFEENDGIVTEYTDFVDYPIRDIKSIGLISSNSYFEKVKKLKKSNMCVAPIATISIKNAYEYPYRSDSEDDTLFESFEFDEGVSQVIITPLVDNAEFEYMGEVYSFDKIQENTTATLTLSTSEDKNDAKFVMNDKSDAGTEEPAKADFTGFGIKDFSSTLSVDYKSTVIFHTTMEAPNGYEIVWSNGIKGSEFKLNSVTDKEYKVSAKMVNKTTGKAETVTEEVTITVNTGFFARLIAFFRTLFRSLPVYEDFKKK